MGCRNIHVKYKNIALSLGQYFSSTRPIIMNTTIFPIIQIPKSKNCLYALIFFIIDLSLSLLLTNILNNFSPNFGIQEIPEKVPLALWFVGMVIIAPLFETLVFQFLILELLIRLKVSPSISIVISLLIFSLFHNYNTTYIIYIICAGWVLPYYYMALRQQGKYNKILFVSLLHAASNGISFLAYL